MSPAARTDHCRDLDAPLRWALAVVAMGAAFLHFAVMGEHFDVSVAHGVFFAAAAWLQLAFAMAVVIRPSRGVMWFGALLNLAIMGAWLVSRVWGVPFGAEAWVPEAAQFPDVLATVLEGVLVAGCLAVITGYVGLRPLSQNVTLPAVGALGATVVILSTLSLVPSVAGSGHTHGSAGSDVTSAATGHTHGPVTATPIDSGGAAIAPVGQDHNAGGAAVSPGIEGADGNSPCERTGPPVSEGQAAGGHGHRGPSVTYAIADQSTRDLLATQLEEARTAAMALPTLGDAEAAGYRKVTTYLPCIGAHLMKYSYVDGTFDPTRPEMLLYDGNGPDAHVVGLSYYVLSGNDRAPDGFAGPNDPWHQHIGLCVRGGLVIGSEKTTAEECKGRGGVKADGSDAWMVHAWAVPGWESPWGIFSGEHPELGAEAAS
jgi:hypothetical protein